MDEFCAFAAQVGIAAAQVHAIPLSALRGDNVTTRSASTPYYDGPPLLPYLEEVAVEVEEAQARRPLRLPVQ